MTTLDPSGRPRFRARLQLMARRSTGPWVALVIAVAMVVGCGGSQEPATAPTSAAPSPAPDPSRAGVTPTTPIPDTSGRLVLPVATGLRNPAKAWEVPDAVGTDLVSALDAEYLALARPAVPYRGPGGSVSNLTLITIGKKACAPATSYEAGGAVVAGPAAEVVHRAALRTYC